jgi:hypothetical protein
VVEALVGWSKLVANEALGLDPTVLEGHRELDIVVRVLLLLRMSWRKVP